jgi:hypothetical protein
MLKKESEVMKVVINAGGISFYPSELVFRKLINLGWKVINEDDYTLDNNDVCIIKYNKDTVNKHTTKYGFSVKVEKMKELRTHLDFVVAVEELGELANGMNTKLKVLEIPDDVQFEIVYHFGLFEIVQEKHRIWY